MNICPICKHPIPESGVSYSYAGPMCGGHHQPAAPTFDYAAIRKEARREALEDAAALCDTLDRYPAMRPEHCAAYIRALITKLPGGAP